LIQNRIRVGIQPEMLDPDPDSMNPDPKHCREPDMVSLIVIPFSFANFMGENETVNEIQS
jgi:hypothetical protein